MQGIIIAAGMGSRMGELTHNKPKCLLKVGNKTLLEYAVEGLKYAGCRDIYIITGYKEELISKLGYRTIHNRSFQTNNILHSFSNAFSILNEDTLVSYSDIYVEKKIFKELSNKTEDIVLTIDKNWRDYSRTSPVSYRKSEGSWHV